MKRRKSLNSKILYTTTGIVLLLAVILVLLMTYFMGTLTENILLGTLPTMAKTASQSVEGNLHILGDRIFTFRSTAVFANEASTLEERQAVLERAKSGIEFVWIALYSPDGALLTGSGNSPTDLAGTPLLASMQNTVNLVIDDTQADTQSGQPEIVMGAPLTKRVGDDTIITGYLVGSYKYDVLNDVLSNINIGSSGTAFIINDDGKYMAHRDITSVSAEKSIWDDLGSGDDVKSLVAAITDGRTGAMRVNGAHGPAYFCYAPVRGTNWALAITAPRSDFTSDMHRAILTSSIITLVLLVLVIVFFSLFTKKTLTTPLRLLTDNASELAHGRTTTTLPQNLVQRSDEIGSLSEAFTNMTNAINAMITDTNTMVLAAEDGNLSVRADAERHEGDYRKIIAGLNQTIDLLVRPIYTTAHVLGEMEKGNLSIRIEDDVQGDLLTLKNSINGTLSSIQGYISEVSENLQALAAGDLSVQITSDFHGEFVKLKNAINEISASLSDVMANIHKSADMVAAGTQQVFHSAQEASSGAMRQEASIEELLSMISAITEETQRTAAHANQTNKAVHTAKQFGEDGRSSMQNMQLAMQEINESSNNISKIIKVIDDLAFQTNILALNAAVEAARAGSYGKGFAVVAEEVRNLAAKSATAAKDTSDLIEGSIGKAEAGTAIANGTFGALGNILNSVDQVSEIVYQIATASNNQAQELSQINNEINQLSSGVQANSAHAQITTEEAQKLADQANLLKSLVGRFHLGHRASGRPLALGDGSTQKSSQTRRSLPPTPPHAAPPYINDDFGKY